MNQISIEKKVTFSAAHRVYKQTLSEEENLALYQEGSKWHGHSYVMWVTYSGKIDPSTSLLINFSDIDSVLAEFVSKFDHCILNELDVFSDKIPTGENIAIVSWQILKNLPFGELLSKIRLGETEECIVEYTGG